MLRATRAALALALAFILSPAAARADSGDGPPRLSLPTEADRVAWRDPGFRLTLGFDYGDLVGLRGAPSGRLLGPLLRIGLRLDGDWSIAASFHYTSASRSGGLSGLRFAGTVDPIWHVTSHVSLAVGFGFGGIVEGSTGRTDPGPTDLDTSYTFPSARAPISSCSGIGMSSLARASYFVVLGPRASTGLSFEVVGQYTGCTEDTGVVDPDTGLAIVRHQWWPHAGASLAWEITWR